MTKTSKEEFVLLERLLYIHYLLYFWKNIADLRALIDSGSEVNTMTLVCALKLGLKVYHTIVGAQIIDNFTFEIFRMVLASFQIEDKLRKAQFFQKTFLLADMSMKVVLNILFLTLSNEKV